MILDRLIIENKKLWIIDFKTSQPGDEMDINHFISHEIASYRGQLQLYYQAIQQLWPHSIQCVLYFPLLTQAWIEIDMLNEKQPALG